VLLQFLSERKKSFPSDFSFFAVSKTGSASRAGGRRGKGGASIRLLPPLDWDPNPSTGTLVPGRLGPCIGGMGFCPNLTYRKCAQALQRQDASLGPCRYPTVRPKPCWMEVAIVLDKIEAGAVLENCHALINQMNARLSAEEPFVDVSSATEVLSYLERAASVLASPSISGNANGSPSSPLL
jgi:hypothetical protein